MAFHTFGPGLALDEVTGRGIPAVVAQLTDAETGDPVQAYTMDDEPSETTVSTNRYGYFGYFQVPDTVRRLRLTFGGLTLEHTAWELLTEAAADAAASLQAALGALQAAQEAADLVQAPADNVVATLIKAGGSDTGRAIRAEVASTITDSLGAAVSVDELQHNILIDTYNGANSSVPNGIATILYAPYKLRITRLTLMFDSWNRTADATDYATFTLRRWDTNTMSGQSIVAKHTSTEAVTARKPWMFDALYWSDSATVIEAGQAVSLGWAVQGAATLNFPMLVSIGVEPL